MKINSYVLITVVNVLVLLILVHGTTTTVEASTAPNPSAPPKKSKPIIPQKLTLKKPLRLYNTRDEKLLTLKVRFLWQSSVNKDPKIPQNIFDYKLLQINKEHIVIYRVDQSLTQFDDTTVNSSNYLMTIKLENLDLLCNDHYFLCTVAEFKREFKKKLKHINMTTDKRVTAVYPEAIARKNCIMLTIGLFSDLSQVGYMCFDEPEDTIFFLDLISERVLKRYKGDYDGQLRLINQNGNGALCLGGQQDGILKIEEDKLLFSNGKPTYSKKFKKYLEISFKDIYGYANVLYGFDTLPWKLEPKLKPSEFRCFKFTAKVLDAMTNVYFCIMNERQDWRMQKELSIPEAEYENDLWVAMLNYKLHLFNLKHAQDLMVHTVKDLDCNDYIMEPIKYEYRNNYLWIKHKTKQLIELKKIQQSKIEPIIKFYDMKLKKWVCKYFKLCIKAIEVCTEKGFIPLKYKGHTIAWSLQNPYVVKVPKLGIHVREYPRNTIGLGIVKTAEMLTGLKPTQGRIVVDNSKYKYEHPVESLYTIHRSLNTMKTIFKGVQLKNMIPVPKIIERYANDKEKIALQRKLQFLSLVDINDPFFELLGYIRDQNTIGDNN